MDMCVLNIKIPPVNMFVGTYGAAEKSEAVCRKHITLDFFRKVIIHENSNILHTAIYYYCSH